ncbi:MAG: hypothetical protein ABSG62_21900 [Terracidiphilus sp.]
MPAPPATRLGASWTLPVVLRKHAVAPLLGPVAGDSQQALVNQLTHSLQLPISSNGEGENGNHPRYS